MSKANLCLCLLCICTFINLCIVRTYDIDPIFENSEEAESVQEGKKQQDQQVSLVDIPSASFAVSDLSKSNDSCPEAKFNCERLQHRVFVGCIGRICGHCLPGYRATTDFTTCLKIKKRFVKFRKRFLKKYLNMASLLDPDLVGLDEALKQRDLPVSDNIVVPNAGSGQQYATNQRPIRKKDNTAFIVMMFVVLITILIFMMIIALLLLCWCGCFEEQVKEKPMLTLSDSMMDRKLAQSAQVYHFQHEKQRIIAEEQETAKTLKKTASAHESDEENDGSQHGILEFPGPAVGEQLEVRNPLFHVELHKSSSSSTASLLTVSVCEDPPPQYQPYESQE